MDAFEPVTRHRVGFSDQNLIGRLLIPNYASLCDEAWIVTQAITMGLNRICYRIAVARQGCANQRQFNPFARWLESKQLRQYKVDLSMIVTAAICRRRIDGDKYQTGLELAQGVDMVHGPKGVNRSESLFNSGFQTIERLVVNPGDVPSVLVDTQHVITCPAQIQGQA
jgi:hypothetical protein